MLTASLDLATVSIVLIGAFTAGFTTGFAGFGTGIVASGLWFHALPAAFVPPLVTLASVAGHIIGLITVRRAFDWPRALPFLLGGAVGVPFGVAALRAVSPDLLKLSAGCFLIAYAVFQLLWASRLRTTVKGNRAADGAIGLGGGFLGGFSGLSGPLPLIWLRLQGGGRDAQRAVYQPFNLIVLAMASAGMAVSGQMTGDVLRIALICLPVTLVGAWTGARVYVGVSEQTFQRFVLTLLFVSGCILVAQAV